MIQPLTHPAPLAPEFEEEFIAGLKAIFEEKIVFNQLLGLKVTSLKPDRVTGRIEMRPELIGHYAYNRVHGGVISAGLDAMGGLAVMAAIGARHMDEAPAQRLHRAVAIMAARASQYPPCPSCPPRPRLLCSLKMNSVKA